MQQGMMPMATMAGIEVGFCSEKKKKKRVVIEFERETTPVDKAGKADSCPFAVASAPFALLPGPIADIGRNWFVAPTDHVRPIALAPGRGLAAPPPFATGPPSLL